MSNNEVLVSVIIPTFNSEKFIRRTILSVQAQTLKNWELICVDDFSTDATREILLELAAFDGRIKLFFLENNSGEPATPKNVGGKHCIGKYIAYLDHDDEWAPEKLAKQVEFIEKNNNIGVVFCNFEARSGNASKAVTLSRCEDVDECILNYGKYIGNNSCALISKRTLSLIGERDPEVGAFEDMDMWFRVLRSGYRWDRVNECLVVVNQHGDNFTEDYSTISKKKAMNMARYFENFIKKYDDLYRRYPKVLGGYNRGIGLLYILSGDSRKGRISLKKAITYNDCDYKSLAYFLLSYFGLGLLRWLFIIKKKYGH